MKRKVFSLMMLCLFAFLGLANAQVNPGNGGLTVTPDPVEMGYRPNGAWMRPFEVQLTNPGSAQTITSVETTNEDFFIIDAKVPESITSTKPYHFTIDNADAPAGPYNAQLVVWTSNRLAYTFDLSAIAYDPIEADVVETAPTVTTSFSATVGEGIYDNYQLPGDAQDGKDVIYKMEIANDVVLDANVVGDNGKVAVYLPDFNGKPGPGADNNYAGNVVMEPFEVEVGPNATTSSNSYFPFYTFYNYSIAENLFHADELAEAGVNTTPMVSLSWYANNQYGQEQKNLKIWMANVTDDALTSASHSTADMTLVYSGNMTPAIGWNEFVFNEGSFAWDGTSNVLICVQRNNGSYHSGLNWKSHTATFSAQSYTYRDSAPYDMETQTYTNMTVPTAKPRANTMFKSQGAKGRVVAATIDGMTLTPGEYYLAASSTSDEFTVNVNMGTIPLPEPVSNPYPANGDMDIAVPVTMTWTLGQYTTAYRVLCGSTLPLTQVVVDWTDNLSENLTMSNLYHSTNYFWRVDERNSSGEVIGPVWGFTTAFNIPQNVTATPARIYEGDAFTLSWDDIIDRTHRSYNVYQDGVKINTQPVTGTEYEVTGLTYNMEGYIFNVTAVYDEGESNFSNDAVVLVSGKGTVSGKVTEQDGTTGIAGAQVVFTGKDEFLVPATYTFTTGANGTYNGQMLAGVYEVMAKMEGYQAVEREDPVTITYNQNTPNINFSLDENWDPVAEVIAEVVDENQVRVYWSQTFMSELIEDFETGDLSMYDWVNTGSYPWAITTTSPHSGNYCLKSGNYNVASSTSSVEVNVEVPRNGLMSFWVKPSCETNWDMGYFYIDNQEKASFTGNGSWTEKEYPITAGLHTFKWAYTKDGSVNSNDDCIYIDDISFVHDAAPAETGWIGYDNGQNEDAIGLTSGGSFYWGISFPAAMMAQYGNFTMTKVKLFDHEAHTGKVMIYKGGESAPGTLVTEQNYTCTGSENYVEVNLSNPVSIDGTQSIWVVLTNLSGQYVASCCANTGDANGRWISMDGVDWMDILEASASLNYSWQIQAYVTDGAKGIALDRKDVAAPAPMMAANYGASINDLQGDPNWKPSTNRAFNHYNIYRTSCYDMTAEEAELIGSTNDTLYLENEWGTLDPGLYKWGVSRFYQGNRNRYREVYDFENGLEPWTTIDNDGDGDTWYHSSSSGVNAHSGTGVATSASYDNNYGALTPDNWLVSPQSTLGGTMTFWAAGQDPSWASEVFAVYVSTSGASVSNFTQVLGNQTATGTMTQYTVDLSAYEGQTGYVAIRHYNVTDMFRLNVDDIAFGEGGGGDNPNPPTPPTPNVNTPMTYTGVPGESGVVWSNCLENKMYVSTEIYVLTNSADSPEGATVKLTNTSEPELNVVYTATMDETGYYIWEEMRRGTYTIEINLAGFEPVNETVEIGDENELRYVLTEIVAPAEDLYVSSTGWAIFGAMPDPVTPEPPTPQGGEWYYYDNGTNEDAIGTGGGDFYWGVMFPAGSYTGNMVTKVSAYDYMAMSGEVTIYNDGATVPANPVGNMNITLTGSEDFVEFEFAQPVVIDPSKNVWIVLYNGSGATYPAAVSANTGDANGRWVSLDGTTWVDLLSYSLSYTFMVRAYIAYGGKGEVTEIAYEPKPCDGGTLSNAGEAKATRSFEYYQVALDNEPVGTTTNPFFQFDVTDLVEGETYTASVRKVYSSGVSEWVNFDWVYTPCDNYEGLQEDPTAQWQGENVILNWVLPEGGDTPDNPDGGEGFVVDFENGMPSDWTTIDADGDGYTWCDLITINDYTDYYVGMDLDWYHGGSNAGISASYINGIGALHPDNYFVSPQVTLGSNSVLDFWAAACDPDYASDHFGVFVSTTGTNPSDFVSVQEWTLTGKSKGGAISAASREGKGEKMGTWRNYQVDLSSYAGQQVYIAFRHFDSYDWYIMAIDDITLNGGTTPPDDPDDPDDPTVGLSESFESGIPSGWATLDADGDGYTWEASSQPGHTGNCVTSASYINDLGALNPDNYLVTPQVALGGTVTFYACAQDASYAAEHFGLAVSTTTATAAAFTTVQEWTMTAKGTGAPVTLTRSGNRAQGNWYQYTVDLSSYAGQTGYLAIRHFNCTDWFYLNVDDFTLTTPSKGNRDITESFESGIPSGWATLDADGDGYTWEASSQPGHTGSCVTSASYINDLGALNPDNYLVTPQVALGGTVTFYACAQDASYAAEHFGLAVSTTTATASAFTTIQEWTMTAKGTGAPVTLTRSGNRAQGNWYEYTVDLSSYAGQTGYVAIRHFNCTDWFYLNVDDFTLSSGGDTPPTPPTPPTPGANIIGVEIFRDGEWIAEVAAPAQTYTDVAPGEVGEYEIRVVYNGPTADYTYYSMSCPEVCVPAVDPCSITPENLIGTYVWNTPNSYGAEISWTYGEYGAWLYYDDGNSGNFVGENTDAWSFEWANMYPAAEIAQYAGTALTKVSFVGFDGSSNPQDGIYTIKIYKGGVNAPETLVYTQDYAFSAADNAQWIEVELTNPVAIEGTQNLWIALYNDATEGHLRYPAGYTQTGTGGSNATWFSEQGEAWDHIDNYLPQVASWIIRGFVTNAEAGETMALAVNNNSNTSGSHHFSVNSDAVVIPEFNFNRSKDVPSSFNVYRNGALIANIDANENGIYSYFDQVAIGNYQYRVTALYADCESPYAVTPDGSMDYVEVNVTDVNELGSTTKLYPNPTTGLVRIEASGMTRLTVVNTLGQVIYDTAVSGDMAELNLSRYNAGIYLVRIAAENGVSVQRVTVVK